MTANNKGDDRSGIHVQGNVDHSIIVPGDGNTVTYTTNVFGACGVEQFPSQPSQSLNKQEYRWRQVLVEKVKHYWIEGVLQKSLHNQMLIDLGLEERLNAVPSPLSGVEEFPDETRRKIPEGTQASDIFDDLGAGRTLLILGDPGAGKTTTLLKLAQGLLERMGDDLSQPIPVILNLSSWAKKRLPIEKWLVQDLYETFQISKALATTWIEDEQLILCLDGLDEVEVQHRNSCVQALNQFIQDHGRTEMVVCSRVKDYETLSEQLQLRSALYVQPLTSQQVDQHLAHAGQKLIALKTALNQNAEIKAFASSPLILSVMSLVYQGAALEDVSTLGNVTEFRKKLFERYIERMFQRRGSATYQYPKGQVKHWLSWMAKRMLSTSQTIFLIEHIQPSWLKQREHRLQYRLVFALTYGLLFSLYGMPFGFIAWPFGLITIPLMWLIGGFLGLIHRPLRDIKTVETLTWSWKATWLTFQGLLVGVATGLFLSLAVKLFFGQNKALIYGLVSGLSGLSINLYTQLRGPAIEAKSQPNEGIWRSAKSSGIAGLIVGLTIGVIVTLITDPLDGLIATLIVGTMSGFSFGGTVCLQHFSLRLMLFRVGFSPWNYTHFLDYATERLFLTKVGGGYIFIHRMLLEHFAQMPLAPKTPK